MGDRLDLPLPYSPYDLKVVLEGISHPGNLGAVSRTMLNMGYSSLRLIAPECEPDDEVARNRAKHSGWVLSDAEVYDDWKSCMDDCNLVIGTSGKREVGSKVMFRHFLLPWQLEEKLRNHNGNVALVFGEEGKGLSTEQLEACDLLVTIPSWEGYPICNLSHSVAHILYELHRARVIAKSGGIGIPDIHEMERELNPELRRILKKSIEEFSTSVQGDEVRKKQINNTLDRVIMRGMPLDVEAQQLLSVLVEATTAMQKLSEDDEWRRKRRRRIE